MQFENNCKICRKKTHCCIFSGDSGFAFVGIRTAKKIRQETGKDYSGFLEYTPLPKKIVAGLKNEEDILEGGLRYTQLDKKYRILRLKKKKDGRCIFLDEAGKCEIYQIRPNICRIYPFWVMKLQNGKLKVIKHDHDSGCGIVKNIKMNSELDLLLSGKQISDMKEIFRKIHEENIHYKKNVGSFVKENNLE